MSALFNQFSYPLFALGILALIFFGLRRARRGLPAIFGVELVIALALVAGFFALRTGDGDIASIDQFDGITANGRPTFIEFFSNFCTGCMVARPGVDALIAEIDGDFNIVRINIHSEAGQHLAQRYRFSFTPEFVLLDSAGGEVWRAHTLPPETQIQALRAG